VVYERNIVKKVQIIIVGLLVIGGIVLFGIMRGPSEVTTTIVLSGAEGLQVTGKYTADGEEFTIAEVLPTEITILAKRVSLLLENPDDSQNLFAEVQINGERRLAGGGTRNIQIDVKGNTMFSSARAFLKAFKS
jgi:hypothetical protein